MTSPASSLSASPRVSKFFAFLSAALSCVTFLKPDVLPASRTGGVPGLSFAGRILDNMRATVGTSATATTAVPPAMR